MPAAVKAQYANPSNLLPGIHRLQVAAAQQGHALDTHEATAEEQEEVISNWLPKKSIIKQLKNLNPYHYHGML